MTAGDVIAYATAAGVMVALILNFMNLRTKISENNPAMIELRMNVTHIRATVDRQDALVGQLYDATRDNTERIVRLEMDVKAAHRRLDEMGKG